jgi:hypothetical protein
MATEFPECDRTGTNMVPLQLATILVQYRNVEGSYKKYKSRENALLTIFTIDRSNPDNWFDYVRHRFWAGTTPSDKWKQHIPGRARIYASGGWAEVLVTNGQIIDGGSACQQFNIRLTAGVKTRGVDLNMVQKSNGLMREAGLSNVTKQTFTAPFGPWEGKAGELSLQKVQTSQMVAFNHTQRSVECSQRRD